MKKIGIMTESFMNWNGGVNFIKHIILALNSVAKENNLIIYILLPDLRSYKKHRGIKRFIHKMKSKYFTEFTINSTHPEFTEFSGCKFVQYAHKDFENVLKKLNIDLFLPHLEPDYFKVNIPSVGYLYDCQHKYYPEFFSENDIKARDKFFQEMVDSNQKIIVSANSVKDDLVKFFGAKGDNICIFPFSPKHKLEYFEDNLGLISKYNLAEKYFIISNQFWLHKDHSTAFKAFAKFVQEPEHKDIQLICTGLMEDARRPEYIEELMQLIDELGCKDKIHCLGLIPKMEQIQIMKGALAVIQPTLFEGGPGGGSVWDAISLGVPAIVSDIATNIEIKEKNIFFFKAGDVDDLFAKMNDFLQAEIENISKDDLIEKSNKNIQKLGDFLLKFTNKIPTCGRDL